MSSSGTATSRSSKVAGPQAPVRAGNQPFAMDSENAHSGPESSFQHQRIRDKQAAGKRRCMVRIPNTSTYVQNIVKQLCHKARLQNKRKYKKTNKKTMQATPRLKA